jgi:hypothetical protein
MGPGTGPDTQNAAADGDGPDVDDPADDGADDAAGASPEHDPGEPGPDQQ